MLPDTPSRVRSQWVDAFASSFSPLRSRIAAAFTAIVDRLPPVLARLTWKSSLPLPPLANVTVMAAPLPPTVNSVPFTAMSFARNWVAIVASVSKGPTR